MPNSDRAAPFDPASFLLPPCALKRYTDPARLPKNAGKTTLFAKGFGQDRALNALQTALDIDAQGYHVFASGPVGLGKRSIIRQALARRALNEATPPDVVYVHNFAAPKKPAALFFDNAVGKRFVADVEKLWPACRKKLDRVFSSRAYLDSESKLKNVLRAAKRQRAAAFDAKACAYNLQRDEPDAEAAYSDSLIPLDAKKAVDKKALFALQDELLRLNDELAALEDEMRAQLDDLQDEMTKNALAPLFASLSQKYAVKNDAVAQYLRRFLDDVVQNALDIVDGEGVFAHTDATLAPARYSAHLLVSHTTKGAPVVYEDSADCSALFGRVECSHDASGGSSEIWTMRAGAVHRANGGYLLLRAQSLLEKPYAWQELKRALRLGKLKFAHPDNALNATAPAPEPQAIDLRLKVILLGDLEIYDEFLYIEPAFASLFKIRADFCQTVARNPESERALCAQIDELIDEHNLPPFDEKARAAVLDELCAQAQDQNKFHLSAHVLSSLVLESANVGRRKNAQTVTDAHTKNALQAMRERRSHLQDLYYQEIQSGQHVLSVHGKAVGQINALTTIETDDAMFGLPARLTAVVSPRFGSGEIVDIERDVELGGNLHAKGMLIMAAFLRSRFSALYELNFSASLAFEQNYAAIDGDSATLAETCALLSALANVPLAQNLAITGSMNQLGQAQAVGGLDAKIAGFFDVCHMQGLDGTQGVIVPRANRAHLMLRDDIVEAAKAGKFFVYAVDHLNEALALLSGMAIDDAHKNGVFKKNTFFGKIAARLRQWESDDKKSKK